MSLGRTSQEKQNERVEESDGASSSSLSDSPSNRKHLLLARKTNEHLILQEDRSCILKLSLEKLRFLEDPEAYLRRSVLINNLLRKIHHEEEEEPEAVEQEEEEEEEELDLEEEDGRRQIGGGGKRGTVVVRRGSSSGGRPQRLIYSDRKRVKVFVTDCCSQPFGLQELPRYRLVPYYPSTTCLYSLGSCPGLPPNHTHQVLLYNLDDNG